MENYFCKEAQLEAERTIREKGTQPLFTLSLNELQPVLLYLFEQAIGNQKKEPEIKLYGRKEVQEFFNITYPTLLSLERRGILKGSRVGAKYLYSRSQIEQALGSVKRPPSSPLN